MKTTGCRNDVAGARQLMGKRADSLSDEELRMLADYYNKNRKDRLNVAGDAGRWLLTGGSLPAVMMYDLNRSGGTQMLGAVPRSVTLKRSRKKDVDAANVAIKGISTILGGLAGASIGNGYSWRDKGQNTAIGAGIGAGGMFLLTHLMQKLGQNRARKMLARLKDKGEEPSERGRS